jgi:hypothetical protein
MAQSTPQTTTQTSSTNLILVGTLSVAVAIGGAAIGYYSGYHSGFADGLAAVLDTEEDERPPIIVGNGGSVTIEAQLHPKGGRGKIQKPGGDNKYQHVDANAAHVKPKGLDLTIYGSSTPDCQGNGTTYSKVTTLKIAYGSDDTEGNWRMITFDDVDAAAGSDLQWTLDSKAVAVLNQRGYILEIEPAATPEWFLKRATFSDGKGPHTCAFTDTTGDQAILIEQKKK